MASSSTVLPIRDQPTVALRLSSAPYLAHTLDGLPPELPTLGGSLVPLPALSSIQVPGYEIHRELGRGGMGVVYLARHRKLDRFVALKMVLARQYAGPEDQARFRQEVEAVAKLNHPNIAQVYEVGEHDGFAFAAFEYVDGGTLLRWQNEKPIAARDAARLIATIARAVQHAHDHGIIHRDLKPANILLQGSGVRGQGSEKNEAASGHLSISSLTADPRLPTSVPKITDFGLAKMIDTQSNLTVTGMACGTPNYMAPEQIRGKHAQIGPATDVYGLGAILFELLTAKPPFRGETPLCTMQAVANVAAPAVRKLREDAPQDLEVIVAKCLEKDPARRYRSAAELAEDLERYLDHRPIEARGVGRIERGSRWITRNPLAAGLMASLAIGLLSVLAFASVLWNRVRTERELRADLQMAIVDSNAAHTLANQNQLKAESRRQDAEAAKAEAEAARKDMETYARSAEQARKQAERSAAKADGLLLIATDSIDTVLAKFATDPRFHDADCLDLRQELLRRAMALYEQLEQQTRTTPELAHRAIRAEYFLGLLTRSVGKIDEGDRQIAHAEKEFEKLLLEHPARAAWHAELAEMTLNDIQRSQQDGTIYRVPLTSIIERARSLLDAAALSRERLTSAEQEQLPVIEAHWRVLKAFAVCQKDSKEHYAFAKETLPELEALLAAMPRNAEVVDLYGNLLLQLALAAADADDLPAAEGYHRSAVDHYAKALQEWFPSHRYTRWNCEYALARQAHGRFLDSQGRQAEAEEAFKSTEFILESLVDKIPELTPYRIELVEANLKNLRRRMRLNPDCDPQATVRLIDTRLAPLWNLGVPTDRARTVLAESKMLLATYHEKRLHPLEAAREYQNAFHAWRHGLPPDHGVFFRNYGQLCAGRAAFQFALARDAQQAVKMIAVLGEEADLMPGAWYNIARTWSELARTPSLHTDSDKLRALEALQKADDAGFFTHRGMWEICTSAPEFEPIRGLFVPTKMK